MNTLRKTAISMIVTGGVATGLVGSAFYAGAFASPHQAVAGEPSRAVRLDDRHDEDQDRRSLRQALDLLTQAKALVDGTHDDFHGRRDPAARSIDQAIVDVHAALGDEVHDRDRDHDHDHDHDVHEHHDR